MLEYSHGPKHDMCDADRSLSGNKQNGANRLDRDAMKKRHGFTLVELLVVIAIIAVLMSVLMPSLYKAKEQARNVKCRSNLKNYGLAVKMYLDDNNQHFPTSNIWLKKTTGIGSLLRDGEQPDGVFWPYIASLNIHMCPSFRYVVNAAQVAAISGGYKDVRGNYSMNSYIGNNSNVWNSWLGAGIKGVTKETDVRRPYAVFTFAEENPWIIPGYSVYPFNDLFFTIGNSTRQIDNFATFHSPPDRGHDLSTPAGQKSGLNAGGANLVFVDGSVGSVSRATTPAEMESNFWLAWPKARIN
jgi:prepilin-type N-terminal cleavage/methylation domain-containing protein/prepilin-type processing-associated H-X9-DG protein